jgi:hypothetical protein
MDDWEKYVQYNTNANHIIDSYGKHSMPCDDVYRDTEFLVVNRERIPKGYAFSDILICLLNGASVSPSISTDIRTTTVNYNTVPNILVKVAFKNNAGISLARKAVATCFANRNDEVLSVHIMVKARRIDGITYNKYGKSPLLPSMSSITEITHWGHYNSDIVVMDLKNAMHDDMLIKGELLKLLIEHEIRKTHG